MFLAHLALFLQFIIQDIANCENQEINHKVIYAKVGEPLVLTCDYNCSSGFIRGHWEWDKSACATCNWERKNVTKSGDMCTLRLYSPNLTLEQTLHNYSCLSEESDRPGLPRKTELLISLHADDRESSVHGSTTASVFPKEVIPDLSMRVMVYRDNMSDPTEASSTPHRIELTIGSPLKLECLSLHSCCNVEWVRENGTLPQHESKTLTWDAIQEEDEGTYTCQTVRCCSNQKITVELKVLQAGQFAWTSPVAAIGVIVCVLLVALAIYYFYCYRRKCHGELCSENKISFSSTTKNSTGTSKPATADSQSDHEVPYADIVISVRGSSTPELSDIPNQPTSDHRPRWREDAGSGSLLHACRSADRLHVHPREVSRKLSTTSEYAVITYSTEALT